MSSDPRLMALPANDEATQSARDLAIAEKVRDCLASELDVPGDMSRARRWNVIMDADLSEILSDFYLGEARTALKGAPDAR